MPLGQRLPGCSQPVGAGFGKPVEPFEVSPVEDYAIGDEIPAIRIIGATAVPSVEQAAGDVGRIQGSAVVIHQLVQAAAPAAVAKRLPFPLVELGQRLFPKWLGTIHDKASIALLTVSDQDTGRGLWMNALLRAIVVIAMGSAAVPALGQAGGFDGEQFVSAVGKGDSAAALALLKDKPTLVNARDGRGKTALIAALETRNDEWAGYLLQQGADPNLALRDGETPLLVASRLGSQSAVGWLITSGARVNDSNRRGETPLIAAVQRRHLAVVRALLDAGADPDKADSAAGYSARDYAKRDNRTPELLRAIEAKKPKP
jgi:uncharacterized protein